MSQKLNAYNFKERKQSQQKISMVTCYDYSFARILNGTNVDSLLIGDSSAMVMHGQNSTLNISTAMLAYHTQAVVRGAPDKFIVADLPFLSYRKGLTANMNNVEKLMKAGAHALKLEGALGNLKLIEHLVQSGVPVMGHLGLTPQSIHTLGGFKVQGKDLKSQDLISQHTKDLENAGCFSLVLECVPSHLAQKITQNLSIPTIGIGAGPHTDGQVLVLQDMLGFSEDFKPKFLKTYFEGKKEFSRVFNQFHSEVQNLKFPSEKESY